MDTLLVISGLALLTVLFVNMRTASDVLCRIICSFFVLFIYNAAAPFLSLPLLGINLITAFLVSVLGLPGGVMLVCAKLFL